jgi:hypothetical protein
MISPPRIVLLITLLFTLGGCSQTPPSLHAPSESTLAFHRDFALAGGNYFNKIDYELYIVNYASFKKNIHEKKQRRQLRLLSQLIKDIPAEQLYIIGHANGGQADSINKSKVFATHGSELLQTLTAEKLTQVRWSGNQQPAYSKKKFSDFEKNNRVEVYIKHARKP